MAQYSLPLVGVTGPDGRWAPSWWCIRGALKRAGAEPVRLTPRHPQPPRRLDALVISGGEDIAPDIYGGISPGTAPAEDNARDRFEMHMLRQYLPESVPILGICRGAQLLNVVLGGDLHQDLRSIRHRTSNRRSLLPCKTLAIRPGSRLQRIMAHPRQRVNSLHQQAVRLLGRNLQATARDADGIIQAIEDRHHKFRLGVQWHPEYLPYLATQQRLFKALVTAIGT